MAGGRHKKCCYRRGCIMRDNQIGGNSLSLLPKHVARGSVACAGLIMYHIIVIWTDILTCVNLFENCIYSDRFSFCLLNFTEEMEKQEHFSGHFAWVFRSACYWTVSCRICLQMNNHVNLPVSSDQWWHGTVSECYPVWWWWWPVMDTQWWGHYGHCGHCGHCGHGLSW